MGETGEETVTQKEFTEETLFAEQVWKFFIGIKMEFSSCNMTQKGSSYFVMMYLEPHG